MFYELIMCERQRVFLSRPPVIFENACIYQGFSTGGLVLRPPVDLT